MGLATCVEQWHADNTDCRDKNHAYGIAFTHIGSKHVRANIDAVFIFQASLVVIEVYKAQIVPKANNFRIDFQCAHENELIVS